MKKSFIILLGFISLQILPTKSTYSQEMDYVYQNILPEPVHPQPASFASKLTVKPSMPYGKINVSYPIYTFRLNDYQLPISLNYQSKGVKVTDVSGWVGLGWNINAGGVIVRNTRGYPDDFHDKYYSMKFGGSWEHKEQYRKEVIGYLYYGEDITPSGLANCKASNGDINTRLDDALFSHNSDIVYDSEPDEFAFSCGPYSGTFYFDHIGRVRVVSDANIKVEPYFEIHPDDEEGKPDDWYEIKSFTLTTPDGVIYKFGTTFNSREARVDKSVRSIFNLKPDDLNETEEYEIKCRKGLHSTWENCNSSDYVLPAGDKFVGVNYYKPVFINSEIQRFQQYNEHPYIYKWYLKEIITPNNNTITFQYERGNGTEYVADFNESISAIHIGAVDVDALSGLYYVLDQGCNYPLLPTQYYTANTGLGELFVCPHYFAPSVALTFSHSKIWNRPRYLSYIEASNGYVMTFNTSNERPDMPGAKRLESIDIKYKNDWEVFKKIELGYTPYSSNEPNIMPEAEIGNGSFYTHYQFRENGDDRDLLLTEDMLEASRHRLFLSSITENDKEGNTLPAYEFRYFDEANLPRRISNHRSSSGYFQTNGLLTRIGLNSSEPYKVPGLNYEYFSTEGFYPFDAKYKILAGNEIASDLSGTSTDKVRAGLLEEIILPTGASKKIKYDHTYGSYFGNTVYEINTYGTDTELLNSEKYDFNSYQYKARKFDESIYLGYRENQEFNLSVTQYWQCHRGCDCVDCLPSITNRKEPTITFPTPASYTTAKYSIYQHNAYSYNIINSRYNFETSTLYEEISKNTSENGSTVSTVRPFVETNPTWYDGNFEECGTTISHASFTTDDDAESAMLATKTISDSEGNEIVKEEYTTDILTGGKICNGLHAHRNFWYENSSDPGTKFYGAIYWNSNEWAKYTQITRTEKFEGGKELTQTKNFVYNTDLKLLTEEIVEYDTENTDKIVTRYSGEYMDYPLPDVYSGSTEAKAIIRMLKKNMINLPVEKLQYKNGKIVGGSLVLYQSTGNMFDGFKIHPYKEYQLVLESPVNESEFAFSYMHDILTIHSFKMDDRYELVRTYDKFDANGNILQYHDQHNINHAFYWEGFEDSKDFLTAQVSNANWFDIYYNSFEYGYPYVTGYLIEDSKSGKYSKKLIPGKAYNDAIKDVVQDKKYKLSAWIKTESGFDSYADVLIKVWDTPEEPNEPVLIAWLTKHVYDTQGEWKLVERIVDLEDRNTELGGYTGDVKLEVEILNANSSKYLLVDDIKFHPVDAQVETKIYDPKLRRVIAKTDVTGSVSKYEYDNFGRLRLVKDNDGNILERYTYHYEGEPTNELNPNLPDMTITNFSCVNSVNIESPNASCSFTINNNGTVASKACKVSYYLSGNKRWDGGDTKLGETDIAALNVSATQNVSLGIDIPGELIEGESYYLIFKADGDYQNKELDELNNIASQKITVKSAPTPPDLTITSITSPSGKVDFSLPPYVSTDIHYSNIPFDVSIRVSNIGETEAPACLLSNHLMANYIWNVEGEGYYDLPSIAPGSYADLTFQVDFPSDLPHYVDFILRFNPNAHRMIEESDYRNNSYAQRFRIVGTPNDFIDLMVTNALTPYGGADISSPFDIKIWISNTGTVSSVPCKLKYYLREDGSSVWQELGTIDIPSMSGTSTNVAPFIITLDLSGYTFDKSVFYMKYEVDSDNQNTEGNEANNAYENDEVHWE